MEEEKHPNYLEDAELIAHVDKVISEYKGYMDELANAVGCLMIGRHVGWKPLYILYSRISIKKYQNILGIDFKEQLPITGEKAKQILGWQIVGKVSNFWKLVNGDLPDYKRTKKWKISE
jgi:hypothetical protein